MMRLAVLALVPALLAGQEGIPARESAAEYKAQAALGTATTIGAEFLGRTVPAPNASFLLKSYVVVELAVFAREFALPMERFSLRLNGKTALLAQTAGMVGASLKYPSWESQRQVVASAGVGDANVILGRDRAARFPGDRRAGTPPPGAPVSVTEETGAEPWDWVGKLAWPDGTVKGPAGGLLYFPYSGNLGKLKKIELLYTGPDGQAALVLR